MTAEATQTTLGFQTEAKAIASPHDPFPLLQQRNLFERADIERIGCHRQASLSAVIADTALAECATDYRIRVNTDAEKKTIHYRRQRYRDVS